MIRTDCRYECGDDDCGMCFIKGYISECDGCKYFENGRDAESQVEDDG